LQIAFATCSAFPGIDDDDAPLARALAARGVHVEPVVWDAPGVDWSRFAVTVIRNTWDYHHHRPRFLAWAEQVDARSTLVNPLAAIRWSTHKRYLRDLEARGIAIVPTAWVDGRSTRRLATILDERGWDLSERAYVVKPAVSAGAENAIVFESGELARAQAHLDKIVQQGDVLVQPYVDSVEGYGERSLIFFEGHFSHAVRKCPALGGDPEDKPLRGSEQLVSPTDTELLFAASVLHKAAELTPPPAYARVDIAHDGDPMLMELELVEPSLFFRQSPGSEARFADLLARIALKRS
jgi:hypothetical protein